MASFKVGTFSQHSTTGNKAITGVGFEPDVVLFWTNGDGSAPRSSEHARTSIGAMDDSGGEFLLNVYSQDNVSTSNTTRSTRNDTAAGSYNGSSWAFRYSYVSMDSDGFTLSCDATDGGTGPTIGYLAIGGISAKIIEFNTSMSTGTDAITGAGFEPTGLLLCTTLLPATTSLPDDSADHTLGIGVASASTERGAAAFYSRDALSTTDSSRVIELSQVLTSVAASQSHSDPVEADFSSFDSDGFTLNYGDADSAQRRVFAICLGGVDCYVGSETQKTSTGTKSTTGVGFQPESLFMFSHTATAAGSAVVHSSGTFGFSDGTDHGSLGWFDSDNRSAVSETSRRQETDRIYSQVGGNQAEVAGEASVSSLDSDGFTLNWHVSDGNARHLCYMALASSSAPPGGNAPTADLQGPLAGPFGGPIHA